MNDERQRRADLRRATWTEAVLDGRNETELLYLRLDIQARLKAFAELNRRVWAWAGADWGQRSDRSQWTSEVIDLNDRACR